MAEGRAAEGRAAEGRAAEVTTLVGFTARHPHSHPTHTPSLQTLNSEL